MRGRKPKPDSRGTEIRARLAQWKRMLESSRPSLRALARELGTSHQLLGRKGPERRNEVTKRRTKAAPIGEKLLTIREAGEVLRLSTRTVRQYAQQGDLEGRIIGGRWRFRRADLDAFFENAPRGWDFAGKDGLRD
jgi:excisionase family DNA binding protein